MKLMRESLREKYYTVLISDMIGLVFLYIGEHTLNRLFVTITVPDVAPYLLFAAYLMLSIRNSYRIFIGME